MRFFLQKFPQNSCKSEKDSHLCQCVTYLMASLAVKIFLRYRLLTYLKGNLPSVWSLPAKAVTVFGRKAWICYADLSGGFLYSISYA